MEYVMDDHMKVTLTNNSIASIERLINVLNEFIDTLKESKKTFSDNVKFCRELRTSRKKFEKEMRKTLRCFHSLQENQQVEIELVFHKALKTLESITPKVKQEIEEDRLFILFSYLLKREINKTLRFFKKSQTKMASHLYSDPTEEILNDPKLQKLLIEQWGDLANEEY
jgi:hypothetical protein